MTTPISASGDREQREPGVQQHREVQLGAGHREEERREDRGERLDLVLELVAASVSATIRPATNAPMIAARPTAAASSAMASMIRKAGTSGVSANSGQVNTSRGRPRARRAITKPSRTSPRPATPTTSVLRREVALRGAGREADEDEGEDVVDERGPDHDLRERAVKHAQVAQDAARDPDAGGREGEADEERRHRVVAQGDRQRPPAGERQDMRR